MSLCILPNNDENAKKIDDISKMIISEGKIVKISATELDNVEHDKILDMYRVEREKQYDEIVEECEEFIDEINLNIGNNKFTQEEVEEMEEVLDGLYRWFDKVLLLDWIETTPKDFAITRVFKKMSRFNGSLCGIIIS